MTATLDALLDAAKQAGHCARVAEVGERVYSVPIVACEWCGAHAAANTVSEKWLTGPCAYTGATEPQQRAFDNLRLRDYAKVVATQDPLSIHRSQEGWVRVHGRVQAHNQRGWENIDAYFAPDAKVQHNARSANYARREAKLPPYIKSACEQAVNVAVTMHMNAAHEEARRRIAKYAIDDDPERYTPGLDEHLDHDLELYEEAVRESVEASIWQAFVQPLDDKDRPIQDFLAWSDDRNEALAEQAYERQMEGW
jgi:hypothetical protein